MAQTKKKGPAVADQAAEPTFTKEQLVKSKTLGLSRDVLSVVLEDGKVYTKSQVADLVKSFLERKV